MKIKILSFYSYKTYQFTSLNLHKLSQKFLIVFINEFLSFYNGLHLKSYLVYGYVWTHKSVFYFRSVWRWSLLQSLSSNEPFFLQFRLTSSYDALVTYLNEHIDLR